MSHMKFHGNFNAMMREARELLKTRTGAVNEAIERTLKDTVMRGMLNTPPSAPHHGKPPDFINDLLKGLDIHSPLGRKPFTEPTGMPQSEPDESEEIDISDGG